MTAFDDGFEFERGRAAFRRESNRLDTLVTVDSHGNITRPGDLSLRDRIAIEAMGAIIGKKPYSEYSASDSFAASARGAYAYADAMLKVRG